MEILYTADNLEVSYNHDVKLLHAKWIGPQPNELIHQGGDVIYKLFVERGLSKMLNDNRLTIGSWYESVDWTSEVWFPRMINGGLKQFAWVFPHDIFAELSATRAMPSADVVKVFTNYNKAYTWLVHNNHR